MKKAANNKYYNRQQFILLFVLAAVGITAVGFVSGKDERVLQVTATAHNSLPGQTQNDPSLTAWGKKLVPGMKAIAKGCAMVSKSESTGFPAHTRLWTSCIDGGNGELISIWASM